MTYRSDVDALAARQAALEFEVAAKTKERDDAGQLLDEARARAKLPILDNIRVATPCHADWARMTGDERARLCHRCDKHVYNISNLTRDEAEALVIAKEGQLCVRYFQRSDGTILLADCEVGKKQKRKLRVIAAGAAATLAGGSLFAMRITRPELERVVEPATRPEKSMAVSRPPPPPAQAVPIEPFSHTMGVPPMPSAEELLRYKQLKSQLKVAKKAHRR
jgi:hypothetical protein